jgi:hypothetical protein
VDTRLHQMQSLTFNKPFFQRGDFPSVVQNGSQSIALQNPWINGTDASPFDQRLYPYICALEDLLTFSYCFNHSAFYLILDVAVGGTNGWFPDNAGGKPWLDGSASESIAHPT